MKCRKILAFFMAAPFIFSGCSSSSPAEKTIADVPDEYLEMRFSDVIDVFGNKERHSLDAYNISDQYINGIIIATAYDENDTVVDEATLLMQNLEPGSSAYDFVNVPIGTSIENVEYDIIRLDSTDSPAPSPEITDENVYDYLYMTHEPMGKVTYGQADFSAYLNNMTTQYFTGTVLYKITDAEENVLLAAMESYKNLEPDSRKAFVDGAIPADEYIVSYEILEYQFTDEPIQ